MILRNDPVPIQDRRADVPDEVAEVIHRSLARSQHDRFADARSMQQSLMPFRDA